MKGKVILTLILAALAFPWLCSINTRDINRYQNKFEAHKEEFEALVSLLKLQSIKVGYPINQGACGLIMILYNHTRKGQNKKQAIIGTLLFYETILITYNLQPRRLCNNI